MVFFEVCGPNEAMVVSGVCYGKPHLVAGGRVFVWPWIQQLQRLSLNTITLKIDTQHVYTRLGVPISVTGIAQVKIQGQNEDMLLTACQQFMGKSEEETQQITQVTLEGHQRAIMGTMTIEVKVQGSNDDMLLAACQQFMGKSETEIMNISMETLEGHQRAIMGTMTVEVKVQGSNEDMLLAACQQFMGKSEKEIEEIAMETLEGHQRAIMGQMTVEEIYKDRKKFSKGVFEVASSDLVNMGISVVSYTLKDVRDDQGYLKALGMTRTAEVKKDARIGEAEAHRDSGIKEARAEEMRMAARFLNDGEIQHAKRDFELKKAAYDMEVQTKKADSELAYELQAAKTKQRIKEEQMQIKVVERGQQIQVQEQEISRREKELEATIKQPAAAEKYRLETLAEANMKKVVMEAEAHAEAVQLKGEAEAFAIEQKAKAEAEQMAKKADAWKDYQDAAMIDMILETLPKVAAEVAAPLSQARKITMVSSGKGDVGAAKLTGEVMDIMDRLPKLVQAMTGVDIGKAIKPTRV